jgi:hypothetical protein
MFSLIGPGDHTIPFNVLNECPNNNVPGDSRQANVQKHVMRLNSKPTTYICHGGRGASAP